MSVMASCLYILREPSTGLESSLFDPRDVASSVLLVEEGLPSASQSFAEKVVEGNQKSASFHASLTESEVLDLLFAHSKIIVL